MPFLKVYKLLWAIVFGVAPTMAAAQVTWWARVADLPLRSPTTLALGADGAIFMSSLFGGLVYRSNDGGVSWGLMPRRGTVASNASGRVATGRDQTVFVSVDNGDTWTTGTRIEALGNSRIYCVAWVGESTMLAGSYGAGIHRSTDDGETWTPVGNPTDSVTTFAQIDAGRLVAGTTSGFRHSTDQGVTWLRSADDAMGPDVRGLTAANGGIAYAGTHDEFVFRSSDGGESWARQSPPPGNPNASAYALVALGADSILAAEIGSGVYLSTDGGRSWSSASSGMQDSIGVYAAVRGPDGRVLTAAGRTDSRLYVMQGASSWVVAESAEAPTLEVYDGGTAVLLRGRGNGVLRVFDVTGREVMRYEDIELSAVPYAVPLKLRRGTYLVMLQVGTRSSFAAIQW